MSVKEDTIRGTKWAAIERFSVQGIQFLLGLIMARLLSPADYGTVGMIAIFLAVSATFVDSGFSNALIRKKDVSEADFSTVFYSNVVISLVCYGVLFVIAPYVAEFFHSDVLCPILRIQSVALIVNSLMAVQMARLTINVDFKSIAKVSVFASLFSGVAGVAMAYAGFGVWSLVWQSILNSVISCVVITYLGKWFPRASFSWVSFRELFSFGSKLLASGLLNTIYVHLTSLVIGRHFSDKDLGFYSRGSQLASFPLSNINGILSKVSFPILSKLQDDDVRLIGAYRKYICMSSLLIFFLSMVLAALADPLVRFLLSDTWAPAIIYLQIYAFAIMFDHICSINLSLLQVKGRSDLFLKLEVIKKTISIAILFSAIPFGVVGICVSKIIYTQIAVVINTYYTGKMFGLGYVEQVRDFGIFLVVSALACIPAFAITFTSLPTFAMLVVGGLVSSAIYYLLLRKNSYMVEVVSIVKSKVFA